MLDNLKTLEISTSSCPTASVIWMHGLGADSSDFIPIVEKLDLVGYTSVRFIFPSAPAIPVTINNHLVMSAWYDISASNFMDYEDKAGLRKSQIGIESLIAEQISFGIPANKIVIAGVSQGGAMAFQTGLRYSEKLAGLLCLSGYLPLKEEIITERHEANYHIPIFQGHGRFDSVISIDCAEKSRELLTELGYQIEWHEYMMKHTVCTEEVENIRNWLCRVLF